jgi:hypothetical protein
MTARPLAAASRRTRNKVVAYLVPISAADQTGFEMAGSTEAQKTVNASIERNMATLGYLQNRQP